MKYRNILSRLEALFCKHTAEQEADREELRTLQRALNHKRQKYRKRLREDELGEENRARMVTRLAVVEKQLAHITELLGEDEPPPASGPD